MGLQINPALPAALGRRNASDATDRLERGLGQQASGLRINRAAEDAAGLAISENLRASIRQLNQEVRSFQSGISLAQTADAGLDAQSDAVGRIRELAVQAGNGTLTDDQRAAINQEAQAIRSQIDETAANTNFNGVRPLDGSEPVVVLDNTGEASIELVESTVDSLDLSDIDLSTQAGAAAAVNAADAASQRINENRANLAAQSNGLEAAIRSREDQAVNEQEAESRLRDLDVARSAIDQTLNEIQRDAGIAAVVRGNLNSETALRLLGG